MRMSTTPATLILPEGGRILDDFYQSVECNAMPVFPIGPSTASTFRKLKYLSDWIVLILHLLGPDEQHAD